MKVLLDTHIWIWHLIGSKELSKKRRQIIENSQTEIWLSPVSLWETHILIERKRLPVDVTADVWIKSALSGFPVNEAKLTFSIAMLSRNLKLAHGDPADRFIAATAIEMDLTLLTADKSIKKCPDLVVI